MSCLINHAGTQHHVINLTPKFEFNQHHGSFSGPIKASKMSLYNPEVSSVTS